MDYKKPEDEPTGSLSLNGRYCHLQRTEWTAEMSCGVLATTDVEQSLARLSSTCSSALSATTMVTCKPQPALNDVLKFSIRCSTCEGVSAYSFCNIQLPNCYVVSWPQLVYLADISGRIYTDISLALWLGYGYKADQNTKVNDRLTRCP